MYSDIDPSHPPSSITCLSVSNAAPEDRAPTPAPCLAVDAVEVHLPVDFEQPGKAPFDHLRVGLQGVRRDHHVARQIEVPGIEEHPAARGRSLRPEPHAPAPLGHKSGEKKPLVDRGSAGYLQRDPDPIFEFLGRGRFEEGDVQVLEQVAGVGRRRGGDRPGVVADGYDGARIAGPAVARGGDGTGVREVADAQGVARDVEPHGLHGDQGIPPSLLSPGGHGRGVGLTVGDGHADTLGREGVPHPVEDVEVVGHG